MEWRCRRGPFNTTGERGQDMTSSRAGGSSRSHLHRLQPRRRPRHAWPRSCMPGPCASYSARAMRPSLQSSSTACRPVDLLPIRSLSHQNPPPSLSPHPWPSSPALHQPQWLCFEVGSSCALDSLVFGTTTARDRRSFTSLIAGKLASHPLRLSPGKLHRDLTLDCLVLPRDIFVLPCS
jgi:hypothetical protein